jgi:hypothetical protein
LRAAWRHQQDYMENPHEGAIGWQADEQANDAHIEDA